MAGTGTQRRRVSAASVIDYGAAIALAVLGLIGRAFAAHASGIGWIDIGSVLLLMVGGILLLVFLLFELYAWLDRKRTARLAESYPGAFIATVPTDPVLVAGADAFALQITGARTKLVASSYMALVADRQMVRFIRGWRRPHPVAEFPASVIERVEIGAAQSGARMIPTLDLICREGTVHGRISVHLMRFGRVVPRFLRDESLDAAVREFGVSTGSEIRPSVTEGTD
ncbi:hypothetical protein [Leifsonia shinshuensis]|uniref:PH domain-containing protein n=1 Tax=Leifsonia shinshuensis TaxID=150026 RepID=A0A7G6YCK9_9MICO|nr:hypothetical protein [Leifsonia shinshuensis]QNE36224.1 hypothetical protein F1C12_14620 [Leifsonia shinshuensis]